LVPDILRFLWPAINCYSCACTLVNLDMLIVNDHIMGIRT
jgi:hypothetical protein